MTQRLDQTTPRCVANLLSRQDSGGVDLWLHWEESKRDLSLKLGGGGLFLGREMVIPDADFAALVQYWCTQAPLNQARQDLLKELRLLVLDPQTKRLAAVPSAEDFGAKPAETSPPEPDDEYQPVYKKPQPPKHELRKLPSGEYVYTGSAVNELNRLLLQKYRERAGDILLELLVRAALTIDPQPSIDTDSMRLTGPGDPGSRGIAFKFRS